LGEKWRRYWIGKSPKTRAAIEEYIERYDRGSPLTIGQVADKHGIKHPTLSRHIVELRKLGLVTKDPFLQRGGKAFRNSNETKRVSSSPDGDET